MHVPFTDSATTNIDDVTHARLHVVRLERLRTLLWSTHRVSVACRRASTLEAGTVVNIEGHSMGTSDNSVTALSLSLSLSLSLARSLALSLSLSVLATFCYVKLILYCTDAVQVRPVLCTDHRISNRDADHAHADRHLEQRQDEPVNEQPVCVRPVTGSMHTGPPT